MKKTLFFFILVYNCSWFNFFLNYDCIFESNLSNVNKSMSKIILNKLIYFNYNKKERFKINNKWNNFFWLRSYYCFNKY